jgi:hypothetical protein
MANCAMMNIPPSEAARLSLGEYEGLVWHWNEAHRSGDEIDAPDPEIAMAILERANMNPALTH